MHRFDVDARDAGLTQYWSSLSYATNVINDQIDSTVSAITFTSDHVLYNRPISKNSPYSIQLNSDPGVVTTDDLTDFKVTMLMQANTSSLWIIKFVIGTDDVGVKINTDTSIDLIWPQDTMVVDDDGNYSTVRNLVTESLIYSEDVSYLSLSRRNGVVSLTLNNLIVSIEGPLDVVNDLQLGGGTGSALVDKIAFSDAAQSIPVEKYSMLFKTQRLDTVPRPNASCTFNYVSDATMPMQVMLDRSSFMRVDDYHYASVFNLYPDGNWSILKRADFTIEYSIDDAVTWQTLGTITKEASDVETMIFRHQQDTQSDYWLDIVITHDVNIPMSFFDVVLDGDVFLPTEIGFGYFDADPGDFSLTSLTLTNNEAGSIRTIEMLCIINNSDEIVLSVDGVDIDSSVTTGYDIYVNGVPRALTTLKPNQIYHIVIVLEADATEVVINPSQLLNFELVGLGASTIAYAESDAYYIYNTFVGNTLISALETVPLLTDGEVDTGIPAQVLDLQWDK